MAYTKILVIHDRLDKSVAYARNEEKTSLETALDYALNRAKTEQTCFETALNCDRATVYADMMATKRRWAKTGRKRKGYHIIQSFAPGEVTPEQAHAVGVEFAQRLLGERYEVIVGTHLDKEHLHNHIVFNSVSFVDGLMYRDTMTDYYQGIRGTSDTACREHGLSVIDPDNKGKQYSEWEADKGGKPTVRKLIRREIDTILAQTFTYKTFLQELRRRGYEVKDGPNVKHTAVRPPGSEKFIRLDSLGDGYTEADLKGRLGAARRGETPAPRREPPKSLFLTHGRRYYVRGGLPRHRPRKLTGFQALCFKYLYLLRGIKRGRPATRTAFDMRQELIKFDRYQRQFLYLHKNRIETQAQLSMQYDAIQAEIDTLTDCRKELYRLRRAGDDTVTAEIEAITRQLRPLRRELKLCVQIEGDSPKMKEAVKQTETQKRNTRTRPTKTKTQQEVR